VLDTRGLGEILREADLITESQLEEALRLQKVHGERLASILVRQRVLTEKFAVTYLGRKIGVPAVDLSKIDLELYLFELVPFDVCQKHLVLPVRVDGNRLQLAMADPTDQAVTTEIEFKTGARIVASVALESSLKNALEEVQKALKMGGQKRITITSQPTPFVAPVASPVPAAVSPAPSPAAATAPPAPRPTSAVPSARTAEPARPAARLPVMPLDHDTVFETLAGAPILLPAPVLPPPALPDIEEMETVLVIDDSDVALKLIENVLRKRRYGVVTAKSGREGLAKMRDSLPDLVILDGMLPDVHGFEICQQIKNSERFRHIPVIMLSAVHTGWRIAGDVKQKYGADDYVTKPFEALDLLRRVQTLLKRVPVVPPQSEAAVRQHLKDGVAALKSDHVDDAIAAFQRGLAVDQFHDLLHYYLAMTLEKKGRVFEAIDHYERAVQVNPQLFDAITALANLYQRQEFWRKARELWELALEATKDESVRARIKEHLLSLL
jgi:DNA-binding response OmpR family regulator